MIRHKFNKKVWNVYSENYKITLNKLNIWINGNVFHVNGWEDIIES